MKIQILGTGCPKCRKTVENAETAVRELGIQADVEKIEQISEIMKFNVMMTPGLAVDGKVKVSGRVPSVEDIKGFLRES